MYLPGIRMRSDLERKRIFGVPRFASTHSAVNRGIYSTDASTRTYELLLTNARSILRAGFNVIVDASFQDRARRKEFQVMADESGADYLVLDVKAPMPVLRQRIARRQAEGGDPSEASLEVLEQQVRVAEPVPDEELPYVMGVTSRRDLDVDLLASNIRMRLQK
jgi:predicted kinase